ncbi:MAG TPA: VanZ family protein [Candidatus Limnocylindria bacterium]|nr:VanZ family protein [Candidatus Limnocylindria bacterium]
MGILLDWFVAVLPGIAGMALIIAAACIGLVGWRAAADGWRIAMAETLPDALLLAAVGAIVVLTLGAPAANQPEGINLVPFRDILWAAQGKVDPMLAATTLAANVLLFVPLGILLAARYPGASRWLLTALAAIVSLMVEGGQAVLETGRLADVTDLVANTAGAALGIGLRHALAAGGGSSETHV